AYTFRCDVEGWPDVIGSDIPIKINGIAEPVIVAEEGKPNRFFQMQAKKILSTHLSRSETISLHNIKRGTDFSLIADVVIDSNSLAGVLIENGFARRLTEDEIKKTNPITAFPRTLNALNANHQRPAGKNANNSNYLASKNSKVFHEPSCRFAKSMDEKTVLKFSTKEHAIRSGRRPCKVCGQ
ncbi:MAG: hypothetical protein KAR47_18860, partial [Planctomycetes bacterium]|nr:hypothetical protein [Planctomycetota bacterium]